MNLDGGMAQGVYGDNCSYMYQGYGCTPYGASPTSVDVFAPNKTSVAQREMSTTANADHVPSNVMNNGNSVGMVNVISRASLVPKSRYNILLPLLENGIDINSPDELNPLEDSMLLWEATLSQAPNHLVLLLQFQSPRVMEHYAVQR
ncbi:hypothetical protein KIW84_056678 [Lathyrus oleraceus]|uniref:Importin-7/11-like TPR repeats domain-containing protein n=1 Tax=Pisum sativum TaxID=3888 RepID=A0A9D4X161_PEA|nr:hypothetical protein KIW84_056678 [Pisum sativum]